MAQSLISNKIGIQNFFQSFSREQEREADIYAINTLKKLDISPKPLLNFLNLLEKKSIEKGFDNEHYKFSSHPIFEERYNIIDMDKNVGINNYKFDEQLNTRFKFIKGKMFGYTENEIINLRGNIDKDYLIYAKSIILSKNGKLKESMLNLNKLLKKYNYNEYLLETKADILYSNGFFNESLLFYKQVVSKNNSNHYVLKRMFDINFSMLNYNNSLNTLDFFEKNKHLINKFYYDKRFKNKLKTLAIVNDEKNWVKFFEIDEYLNSNNNKNKLIIQIEEIKKNTSDLYLKKIIKQIIKKYDEKI